MRHNTPQITLFRKGFLLNRKIKKGFAIEKYLYFYFNTIYYFYLFEGQQIN